MMPCLSRQSRRDGDVREFVGSCAESLDRRSSLLHEGVFQATGTVDLPTGSG